MVIGDEVDTPDWNHIINFRQFSQWPWKISSGTGAKPQARPVVLGAFRDALTLHFLSPQP
jgi:hypothetical protein